MKKKFVIIGAGLAGLTCANLLAEKDIDVTIIEKQKTIGGLAAGINENGFSMDIGPHYMVLPKDSVITEKIKNMLGEKNLLSFLDFANSHKAYFNNKVRRKFPTIKEFLNQKSRFFRINVFLEIFFLKIKLVFSKSEYKSGNEYLKKNYGKLLYENWFKYYYSNIFEEENLPKDFVMNQFPPIELKKRRRNIKGSQDNLKKSPFFDCYPRFGMNDLIKKLNEELTKNKVEIILDSNIESIERKDNEKIITYEKDDKKLQLVFDGIVFAVPPSKAINWLSNSTEKIKLNSNKTPVAYNAIITYLFVDQEKVFDGWIINLYDPKFLISRISQQNHLSKNIAPEGKSLLTIEIKCNPSDKIWKNTDDEIYNVVIKEIKKMDILNAEKIFGHRIIRIPRIYPKFNSIQVNDEKLVNLINSNENEYTFSHEYDSNNLISNDTDNNKQYRLGGMLIGISSAYNLVEQIIINLKK